MNARRLRELLDDSPPLIVPFAYDAFSAKLIEAAGFPAAGISGSSVAASAFGLPDVGLLSREDVVGQSRRIAAAVTIPVFADADTGYGGPLQAAHTIRAMEDAGLAGLFMEDQEDPKRCAHLAGTVVIPIEDMLGKLKAALGARRDKDFVIIARTDAVESEGVQGAAKRARAYLDAGADMAFFAGPSTVEELEQFPKLVGEGKLMVVLTEGGKTPLLPAAQLADMGYTLIGYSGLAIGAAAKAVAESLDALKEQGANANLTDRVMPIPERNVVLELDKWQQLEEESLPRNNRPGVQSPSGRLSPTEHNS